MLKYIRTCSDKVAVSRVVLGCMHLNNTTDREADAYIDNALACGYNYFDHADIYGGGKSEEVFGGILRRNPSLRDKIVIQTKCGIRKGMYDFSKEHILSAVEGSLSRLGVERIDPQPYQIELLQRAVAQPLKINQMQLSITNAHMVSSGANVNLENADGVNYDGYLRDYCRLNGITIQPWSPLQYGFIEGSFLTNEKFADLNAVIREMAAQYGITDTGLAIAWILRLPEKMQPIVGSTNPERLRAIAKAADVTLSAADWYKIYLAAGYRLP